MQDVLATGRFNLTAFEHTGSGTVPNAAPNCDRPSASEHTLKFASRLLNQFAGVLSCFDRVIFKGYLPFHSEQYLNSWVDYEL